MKSYKLFLPVAVALAVIAFVVTTATAAHAQGIDESLPPAADLVLSAEPYNSSVRLWVVYVQAKRVGRHPLAEVRDVKVQFAAEFVRQGAQNSAATPRVLIYRDYWGRFDDDSVWTIPTLDHSLPRVSTYHPRAFIEAPYFTRNPNTATPDRILIGQSEVPLFRVTAKIIGSDPAEPPADFEDNNTLEFWFNERDNSNGDAGVNITDISGRAPGPGEATTFTVLAENDPAFSGVFTRVYSGRFSSSLFKNDQYGVQVKIDLSPGLTFAGTQAPPSGTTFSATTGIWDIGTLRLGASYTKSFPVAVNLTSDSLADLPLEKRCMTAEVVRAVPWFESHLFKRENDISHACLGGGPKILPLTGGELVPFNIHDCVGVTTYPCTSADTVEVLAATTDATVAQESTRGLVLGSAQNLLRPEGIVVQVRDPAGRVYDKLPTSLTDEDTVSWNTGREEVEPSTGVSVGYSRAGFSDNIADWASFVRTVTVSGLDGAAAPGQVRIRGDGNEGYIHYRPNPTDRRNPFTLSSSYDGVVDYFLEFTALGTYLVEYAVEATRTDNTVYTGSGTYTFHVGPIAELEVRDGGASPAVAANRQAHTIMAVNNGPDEAPAVRVTGLPTEATDHYASHGEYDPNSGIWTIGRLGVGENPTLALIAQDANAAPITATIENTQDYRVVIDGTTHSTHYYDHIDDNNTATVAARVGTGEGYPGAPSVTVMETPVANILMWQPVERVNGFEVTHYEVQRSASPWDTLADDVEGIVHADIDLRPGQLMQYRVRAVNVFGVGGPWSGSSFTGPDAPGDFTAEQLQGGDVRLTWTKPDGNGAEITGYTIEVSVNGGESWSNTGANLDANDTSWTHSNLSVGPARLYRIRASTDRGHGPWAQATSASIAAPILTADYGGPSEVLLSWTMPAGNTVPVLSWELEHSPDGVNWRSLATVQAADGMRYTDRGLSPGTSRYYRVRASTALGHGPWSEAVTAVTAAGVPRNFRAQANGPNEILLTWAKPSGDAEIWGYQIQRKTEGVDWSLLTTVYVEDGTSYVDGGLSAGDTWTYRVRAISIADGSLLEGDWTAEASATTSSGGPESPKDLAAEADGANAIKLSWTEPEDNGAPITGYRIEHSTDVGATWALLRARHSGTTYLHTGLPSGTTHHYRVAAINRNGMSTFASVVSATTGGDATTVPGIPTNLRVTSVDRDRVSIAWNPPENDGGSRVTGYEYLYTGPCAANPADLCFSDVKSTGGTSASVSGLAAGQYTFEVRAVNAVGAGEWAGPVWATVVPEVQGRVIVTPDRLTVTEGGSATYRVRLSTNPSQPIQLGLFWDDPGGVLSDGALAAHQGMLLLPSNYTPPEGASWDGWAYRWDVGIPITVEAVEDDDAESGAAVIFHDVWTAPAELLGNPPDWAEDPVYHFLTGPGVIVAVRDND